MTTYSALVAMTTVMRVDVEVEDHQAPGASAIAAVQAGGGTREVPPTYKVVEIGKRPAEWADAQ